ncbi:MAG: polyprenol monophosphomannose synthase [Chloroflexota bacterium]
MPHVMLTVSVVLPTFNERQNIADLIAAIQDALPSPEIVVVDDNSPDGTWQVVRGLAMEHPSVRLIHRTDKRGLTSAIQRGIDEARGAVVCWMDCDFSMPPMTLPLLLKQIEGGADVAIGSRYAPGGADARGHWMPIAFSAVINFCARLLLGGPVRDYTTGFVAARKTVLAALRLRGDYGEYCIDFLARAKRKGYRIVEVAYVCQPRAFGQSKTAPSFVGFITRGWKYVTTILRLAVNR